MQKNREKGVLFYSAVFPSGFFFTQLPIPLVGLFLATRKCCFGITQKVKKEEEATTTAHLLLLSIICRLPIGDHTTTIDDDITRAALERSDFAVRRVPLIFAWK